MPDLIPIHPEPVESTLEEFINSFCVNDRPKIRKFLEDNAKDYAEMKSSLEIAEDRYAVAEREMCRMVNAYHNDKRRIKEMLKTMGVQIKRGTPLNHLFIKHYDE